MIQDPGPIRQLGFGVQTNESFTEGEDPSGSVISKFLHDKPVVKFLTATAATMVSMALAGQVVRRQGVKLGVKLQQNAGATAAIKDLRRTRDLLDEWQGITREARYYSDDLVPGTNLRHREALYVPDKSGKFKAGGEFYSDGNPDLARGSGFFLTREERRLAREEGKETAGHWTLKDEISQRLVSQGRRLPYELPAAYVAQRGITDPLLGENREPGQKVNWTNPIDVVTDFVTQSVKNVGYMVGPFDVAQGSAVHGWRRLLTYSDDYVHMAKTPGGDFLADTSVNLKTILSNVGQDAEKILSQASKLSAQTSGAFSASIDMAQRSAPSALDIHKLYKSQLKPGFSRTRSARGGVRDYAKIMTDNKAFDYLPRPFKGMQSAVPEFKRKWREIGDEENALNMFYRMGPNAFNKAYKNDVAMQNALNRALRPTDSTIEEFTQSLITLGGGMDMRSVTNGSIDDLARNVDFRNGGFFRNRFSAIYKARLLDDIQRTHQINPELAKKVESLIEIQPNMLSSRKKALSQTVRVGKQEVIHSDTGNDLDFWKKTLSTAHIKDPSNDLAKAMSAASNDLNTFFSGDAYKVVSRQIAQEWRFINKEVMPGQIDNLLKLGKAPYSRFMSGLGPTEQSYLIRETARIRGMSLYNSSGALRDLDEVSQFLRTSGYDPNDTAGLTSLLVTKGKISKPWNPMGGNLLGFKPVTIHGALGRGYFDGSGTKVRNEIGRTFKEIEARSPYSGLADPIMPSLYRTRQGRVFDFNRTKQRMWRFMDRVADDFQLPLIHTSPLKLLGYGTYADLRRSPAMQMVSGAETQPFLSGGSVGSTDFGFFFKHSGSAFKGKFTRASYQDNVLKATTDPGYYRSFDVTGGSLISRALRMAMGDMGRHRSLQHSSPTTKLGNKIGQSRINKWKDFFAVDPDQPDSIFNFVKRFRNRKTDIYNPLTFAKLIRDGEISHKGNTFKFDSSGRRVVDQAGNIKFGEQEVADAFGDFSLLLRGSHIPQSVLSKLTDKTSPNFNKFLHDILQTPVGDPKKGLRSSLGEVKSDSQLLNFADTLGQDLSRNTRKLPVGEASTLSRAYNFLVGRHVTNAPGRGSYWDEALPGLSQSGTIVTRRDQLIADLQQYMIVRQSVLDPSTNMATIIADIESGLTGLKSRGQLSDVQYKEARTALLGMAVDFSQVKGYSPQFGTAKSLTDSISTLRGLPIDDLLSGFEKGIIGNNVEPPIGVGLYRFMRGRFGTAPYKFHGTEYNPFGASRALVPTFGSSFARNPWGTLANAAGITTYNDPSTFTGSSIPVSHLVDRLNRYADIGGLGLDPTRFAGPLDMYARGMVGMRALPIFAGGAAALTVDRSIGGMIYDRDDNGERVYAPFFLGGAARLGVEAQAAGAHLFPGGMDYFEKREELLHGEVPVRKGRYWLMGNTPFKGGQIDYYRPSWYRRLMSGYQYTSEGFGSPIERLAFGYDFSPLRPLSQYHYEEKHGLSRPYPVSGEYFTGPWGPLTPALNAALGPILKPRREYSPELVADSPMMTVGQTGAQFTPSNIRYFAGDMSAVGSPQGSVAGGFGSGGGGFGAPAGGGGGAVATGTGIGGGSSIGGVNSSLSGQNAGYAQDGMVSRSTARNMVNAGLSAYNADTLAGQSSVISHRLEGQSAYPIVAGRPVSEYHSGVDRLAQFGFSTQEMMGIYGFGFGAVRSALGFGSATYASDLPELEGAERGFGTSRGFFNLNIGGFGDFPSPFAEGNWANLELSEIVRRFIYNERNGMEYFNPIPNLMGAQYPWLPGADNYVDFTRGDPFSKVLEGELRMPGVAYERLNDIHPDEYGRYGLIDQLKILGDIAPYSREYSTVKRQLAGQPLSPDEQEIFDTTLEQVAAKQYKHEFTPYKYKYMDPTDAAVDPWKTTVGSIWETISHADTILNRKFLNNQTALEDWERNNVYGATFPTWESPIESFIDPMFHQATQRNAGEAASSMGLAGALFFRTPQGKALGGITMGALGAGASLTGTIYEKVTGKRYIPMSRKKELALEEYIDVLNYVKNTRLASTADAMGDSSAATQFQRQAGLTMYGMDLQNASVEDMVRSVPKRKREHFKSMLYAPKEEHRDILSTAGRLERRMLQAAWGYRVEERPMLDEYFEDRELPDPNWAGWHPNTNMDSIKIKMGQHLGLDMSEMGYFPQEIRQANFINLPYPSLSPDYSNTNTAAMLQRLLTAQGIQANVETLRTATPGISARINAGVG